MVNDRPSTSTSAKIAHVRPFLSTIGATLRSGQRE
jgi:hypothetical protein